VKGEQFNKNSIHKGKYFFQTIEKQIAGKGINGIYKNHRFAKLFHSNGF